MTNVSLRYRDALALSYQVGRTMPDAVLTSTDGTRKMLFDYGGKAVETAYIPDATTMTATRSASLRKWGARWRAASA